jgi:hypothetical protein
VTTTKMLQRLFLALGGVVAAPFALALLINAAG